MTKVKLYIGCALTHAGKKYKKQMAFFIAEMKTLPWIEVLEFIDALDGEPDPTKKPQHIYTHDIHGCVGRADAMIGEITLPSTGLGWELATAVEKHTIKVIMCAKVGKNISFIPRGAELHASNPHASFHWYEKSIMELVPYFTEQLAVLHEKLNRLNSLETDNGFIHEMHFAPAKG